MHFLFLFYSHNTKSTTWLDPRLVKKAKPPEKCEDGGESLYYAFIQEAVNMYDSYMHMQIEVQLHSIRCVYPSTFTCRRGHDCITSSECIHFLLPFHSVIYTRAHDV